METGRFRGGDWLIKGTEVAKGSNEFVSFRVIGAQCIQDRRTVENVSATKGNYKLR